ncbi:hypothetical protein [Listeria phage vB_Lmo_C2]
MNFTSNKKTTSLIIYLSLNYLTCNLFTSYCY